MAVISKEEFKQKIVDSGINEEKQIELLEDIEDSWTEDVNSEYQARYEAEKKDMLAQIANFEAETANLKAKYKERFLSGKEIKDNNTDITDEIKTEEIIDVKEI